MDLHFPGYDVVSTNLKSTEKRFIEIKATDGEWNETGVSMSSFQFANAQRLGQRYWLYVVEFAGDPDQARISAIRDPAGEVRQFMFDRGWRDVADTSQGDPLDAFVPGARVHHDDWGTGTIISADRKSGGSLILNVNVDGMGCRTITVNLVRMRVLLAEDEDGSDDA